MPHHDFPVPSSPLYLLLVALAGIALLVGLVTGRKLNAFLALLIAAVAVGLGAGMAPLAALKAFQDGVGATLGGIAWRSVRWPGTTPSLRRSGVPE